MKILTTALMATVLGLGIVSTVQAAPDVYFKQPFGWAGTGCKAGSVSVTGANTASLSVLFDAYDAGKGKPSASGLGRAACSFSIPIKVPRGFQVSHLTVDWEVYGEPSGQFKRKYFLSGRPYIAWKTNNFGDGNFTLRDNIYHGSLATGCKGGEYNLRINSQVKAKANNSYAAVDSADLNNKVIFLLKFRRC